MLRDLLIDKELFENIREKISNDADELVKRESLEKTVFKKKSGEKKIDLEFQKGYQ